MKLIELSEKQYEDLMADRAELARIRALVPGILQRAEEWDNGFDSCVGKQLRLVASDILPNGKVCDAGERAGQHTLEKLERHLRQLAPHVAARESALLAKEAADRIRELEGEYDAALSALRSVRELCTTDHESKDAFIRRVLLCLPNASGEPHGPKNYERNV
jgi:hypothetical protein